MTKRRTRKQKVHAKHQFSVSWKPQESYDNPEAKTGMSRRSVKWQSKNIKIKKDIHNEQSKLPINTEYNGILGTIKRNLIRSLLIASFILCLELVLYFILH